MLLSAFSISFHYYVRQARIFNARRKLSNVLAGWKSVGRGGGLICHLGVEECFEIFDLYTVKNGANLRDLFFSANLRE